MCIRDSASTASPRCSPRALASALCCLLMMGGPLIAFALSNAGSPTCTSAALVHASCKISATVSGSCADARAEMIARVNGQYATWHDPHNNGSYVITNNATNLELSRTTGGAGTYTDHLAFAFTDSSSGCELSGCSASQVYSIKDFSTNYCNLRMLYCSSGDGCKPVLHDLTAFESSVDPSIGAGKDQSACLKVR